MKAELLKAIDKKFESLEEGDANGHIMWGKFKDFCEDFIKEWDTKIELRKKAFYDSLAEYIDTYGPDVLREFYDYWTEHGPTHKKMRFEKEGSFDLNLRLQRWTRKPKKKNDSKELEQRLDRY